MNVCFMYLYALYLYLVLFFFYKQKTAYEMRISDWSSDVCSSDLRSPRRRPRSDAFFGGFWVAAMQFNPLPTAVTLAMMAMNNVRSEERRVGKECVSTCRSRW